MANPRLCQQPGCSYPAVTRGRCAVHAAEHARPDEQPHPARNSYTVTRCGRPWTSTPTMLGFDVEEVEA